MVEHLILSESLYKRTQALSSNTRHLFLELRHRHNIAGLNMGQASVIAHELTDHLVEIYGAVEAAVKEKIARLRFDWNTYVQAWNLADDYEVVYKCLS